MLLVSIADNFEQHRNSQKQLTTALLELEKYKDFEKTMKEKEGTIVGLSANIDYLKGEIEKHKKTME